ncbi:MAG: hypothetical protein UD936_08140 [Acutalibacteraceae bacterium]|nr:hypothetical protein [Acutalibacteraceae bacterium]
MAKSAGNIAIDLSLNQKAFQKQLNKVQGSTNKASNEITSLFKKVGSSIATAFSVAAVTAFTKKCIDSSASVKALNSQFSQTFGDMQKQAEKALQGVAKSSGIVESRLQGIGTSIYAFAKTTGMDSTTALKMMQEALQVTADSAAYYDRSLEETSESLKSFLKGNYENDSALGLSCTETTRNAMANKLYGKSFQDLSESQKQLALLQMVKEANQLSGAMGQASREADGWENVTGNLKESWKQLLATVGQPILQVATGIVQKLSSALQSLTAHAKTAVDAMSKVFGWKKQDTTAKALSSVTSGADTATGSIEATTKANEKLKQSLAGFDKLNVMSQDDKSEDTQITTPAITPMPTADVGESNAELTATEKTLERIKSKLKEISSKLGFNNIDFASIKSNIDSIFTDLKPIAKSAFSGAEEIAKASFNTISKCIGSTVGVVGKQLQTVTGGVSKWLDKDKTKIANGISSISSNVSSGISNIGSFYESVFTTLGGSVDRMRPTMETAIATFLSGISGLGLSVAEILTNAFDIATENLAIWATENQTTIGLFFDNVQSSFADVASFLGGIASEISETLTGWWYESGQTAFSDICTAFTDVGTTLLNVYNKWIKPVIDCVVGIFQDCWDYTLKPIFEQVVIFFGQLMECIATVWNNFLSPIVNWIIDYCVPLIKNSLTIVRSVFQTIFDYIGGVIKGFVKSLGGVLDFITGIFSGDWEKAWTGIKDFVGGIWDMMWAGIKGTINLMIDGINALWSGFYTALSGIVNGIGSIAKTIGEVLGTDDWGWEIPSEPPLIPKLAKGGLVKAPTLALVGDNAGASTGNPEVVAPLNKLQGMLNQSDGSAEDTAILSQILQYLIKIYEAITSDGNTNIIEIIAQLDDGVLFKRMIELNKQYKKRHNGKSAFA